MCERGAWQTNWLDTSIIFTLKNADQLLLLLSWLILSDTSCGCKWNDDHDQWIGRMSEISASPSSWVWQIHTKVLEPMTYPLKMFIPVCCTEQHYIPTDRNFDWEHVEWNVYGLGQHVKGSIFLEELRETQRTSVMVTCALSMMKAGTPPFQLIRQGHTNPVHHDD